MPQIVKKTKHVRTQMPLPTTPPPAGLKAHCGNCGEDLVTTNHEPDATPAYHPDTTFQHTPGWNIACPNCQNGVFFQQPGTGIADSSKLVEAYYDK